MVVFYALLGCFRFRDIHRIDDVVSLGLKGLTKMLVLISTNSSGSENVGAPHIK